MPYTGGGIGRKVDLWNQKAEQHAEKQKINPFSQWEGARHREKMDVTDPEYGKPVKGSFTEVRGKQANQLISGEIIELCKIIRDLGYRTEDNRSFITFGELFEAYTRISNKLVGMLMRARKQGLLTFEGEMLYQRRDDDVVIMLLRNPDELDGGGEQGAAVRGSNC